MAEQRKIKIIYKISFENPFKLSELIDKFKANNPLYDIRNLTVIDSIEEYSMKYVVQKLNE